MARRTRAAALIVPAFIAALTACSSSSGGSDPSKSPTSGSTTGSPSASPTATSSTPTTTSSSSGSSSDAGQTKAAVAAYNAFTNAVNQAERKPSQVNNALATYGIDPALGTARGVLTQFQVSNIEWRGTPPASRTRVTSVKLDGSPYPTVTITDCPTVSNSWRPYNTKTGKAVKTVKPKVSPPWATTATVALYKGKWMMQTEKTDMTRTCTP